MYTQADIDRWKAQYEDVYMQQIDEQIFIYRAIGRQEYQNLVDAELSFSEMQEEVCAIVTLYPEDHDWSKVAGHADTLHGHVMELSGLTPGQARMLLDTARGKMQIFDHQVDCIIHEAFPEFTMEQIENWPIPKQMKYLARAEFILSELRGVPLAVAQAAQEQSQQPQQQQQPQQVEQAPNGQLTKEQVEAMLSQKAGKQISLDTETKMGSNMPELGWFKATDGLTGDHG